MSTECEHSSMATRLDVKYLATVSYWTCSNFLAK